MQESSEPSQRERRAMTQVARQLRRASTPAEAHVWDCLRGKRCGGLRFLRQHDIGHFVVDFYCATYRLGIEIDGGIHDIPEIAESDREREIALAEERGVRFIRLTNREVLCLPTDELRILILNKIQEMIG